MDIESINKIKKTLKKNFPDVELKMDSDEREFLP